ncbi:hypothetical protein GCM10011608_42500 [Micromonospora sonchi]|uniref:Uncharacterized protein n=1 Tax=Micromonospora sonchi TaxID=1763543 RepID=A0A917U2K0_9ACTN|nr:hypothetical protein [Micromonospora sonchi]GGM53136.1 hypothetical protein GCM10011608_42500 [Micromonospora sonchi]
MATTVLTPLQRQRLVLLAALAGGRSSRSALAQKKTRELMAARYAVSEEFGSIFSATNFIGF